MAETLAEILAEGERVIDKWAPSEIPLRAVMGVPIRVYVLERLLAVAKAAVELFAALDHVTPDWREKTCIIDEDSDEVNVAWGGLELALEHESSTPEQIEHALRAAVRGEGKGGAE